MFGGGGGLDPRKMEQMMNQMGIDMDEIDAEEVIIRTDEYDLVFESPDVTKMDARGQETYQIIGSPQERDRDERDAASGGGSSSSYSDADVELVANRTGATEEEAIEALENNDGDLAAAVAELE